jgi:hypothetical protein
MFDVLKEVLLNIEVFREGTPCRMVNIHRPTGRIISEDLQYRDYFSLGFGKTEHLHPELRWYPGDRLTHLKWDLQTDSLG